MKKIVLLSMLFNIFSITNLHSQILNADFESGSSNWTGDLNLTISEETSIIHGGSKSLNCTFNSQTQANCDLRSDLISSLSASTSYTVEAWFYDNDSSGRANLVIEWYNVSDVIIGTSYYTTYTTDQAAWQKLSYTVTSPPNTAKCKIGSRFYDVTGWDGDCTIYVDDFSGSPAPLPVELTSFAANQTENSIQLTWTTATEVNNYGFEIERALDNAQWENIGFVQGHGNANAPNDYTFTDANVTSGNYQYRLKQIDFDGTFSYSDVVEVSVNQSLEKLTLDVYPNPFNPSTTLAFVLPKASRVNLTIFDITGQKVAELIDNELMEAGYHKHVFDAGNLASGIYISVLQAEGMQVVKKLQLIK